MALSRTVKIEALLALKSWLATTTEKESGVNGALAFANDGDWSKYYRLAREITKREMVPRWELFKMAEKCLVKLETPKAPRAVAKKKAKAK